jgi:hypothetical protein
MVAVMPRGPKGEKRPADSIRKAFMVGRIATGEAVEDFDNKSAAAQLGSLGGKARAAKLSPKKIAKKAAKKRWSSEG